MEYQFKEAQAMLNKVLIQNYRLEHPEKITYIDKIILWSLVKIGKDFSLEEDTRGIMVHDSKNTEKTYFFKNPDINMD